MKTLECTLDGIWKDIKISLWKCKLCCTHFRFFLWGPSKKGQVEHVCSAAKSCHTRNSTPLRLMEHKTRDLCFQSSRLIKAKDCLKTCRVSVWLMSRLPMQAVTSLRAKSQSQRECWSFARGHLFLVYFSPRDQETTGLSSCIALGGIRVQTKCFPQKYQPTSFLFSIGFIT